MCKQVKHIKNRNIGLQQGFFVKRALRKALKNFIKFTEGLFYEIRACVRHKQKGQERPAMGHNCGFAPLIFPNLGHLERSTSLIQTSPLKFSCEFRTPLGGCFLKKTHLKNNIEFIQS